MPPPDSRLRCVAAALIHPCRLPQGAGRLAPMDGVRGVAIILVFLTHFCTLFQPYVPSGSAVHRLCLALIPLGQVGVDLFFVLSGYLIYGILMRRPSPSPVFLRRRCQRIYPPFLCILAIHLIISLLMPAYSDWSGTPQDRLVTLLVNALLLPGIFDIHPIVAVAWSLSYEMAFYLLLPLLFAAGLRRWGSLRRCIFLLLLAVLYLAGCAAWSSWEPGLPLAPFAHPRLALFAAGIVAWEIAVAWPALSAWTTGLEIAAGLLLAAAIPLWLSPGPWYAAGAGVARVVLACVAIGLASLCAYGCKGRFASALAWKPLRWLGYVSYSFYLAHSLGLFALLVVVRWAWPSLQPAFWLAAALAPLAFAAALAPSLLLFSAVEYRFVRPAALSASR